MVILLRHCNTYSNIDSNIILPHYKGIAHSELNLVDRDIAYYRYELEFEL